MKIIIIKIISIFLGIIILYQMSLASGFLYTFKDSKSGDIAITTNPRKLPKTYILISKEALVKSKSGVKTYSAGKRNYQRSKALIKPKSSSYDHLINQIAIEYKVDPSLVKAIIHVESSFNPRAVSSKGAQGLMQLMPGTAQRFGVENPFNTEDNIRGGVKYIKTLMKQFNHNLRYVLAAYNAGENNVIKYKGIPPFQETQEYVEKVTLLHRQYRRI